MSEDNSKQFSRAFPVSTSVELRGVKIVLAPPNFGTLSALEEVFGEDWERTLSRIDVRDRDSFVKLFVVLAQQTDPSFNLEKAMELIDIQNMWFVVKAMQEVIVKSQPDPKLLAELMGREIVEESPEMDLEDLEMDPMDL